VVEDLAAESATRGLPVQRTNLALVAEQMLLAQQPFGRVRVAVQRARLLASAGKTVVDFVRDPGGQGPDWLRHRTAPPTPA